MESNYDFRQDITGADCHDTGKVRGLLCSNCNTGVGYVKNSSERAEKIAAYLRGHGQ